MAKLRIQGDSSGYVDLEAPNAASSRTIDVDQLPQKNAANTFSANTQVITAASNAEALHIKGRSSDDIGQVKFMENDGTTSLGRLDARTTKFEMASYSELHLSANGPNNAHLKIDTFGRVTTPNQPAFRAGGVPPDQNVTTNTSNKLTWATGVAINRGGFYDSAQQRFNAPVAGIYQFSASFWSQASSAGDFAPKVNGSYLPSGTADSIIFAQQGNGDGIHRNISGTFLLNLNVGDYVELWCRNYTMTFYTGHSWWEGHLVG